VNLTDCYAKYQVLALKPDDKLRFPPDHAMQTQLVSGELYRHIRLMVPHNEELKCVAMSDPALPDAVLVARAAMGAELFHCWMNCMSLVRAKFNDMPAGDWYRPLIGAQLILHEEYARGAIGLPSLLGEGLRALAFFGCVRQFVLDGIRDPMAKLAEEFQQGGVS
jgi:hypothetical protein